MRDETILPIRQRVEIITRLMNYEWEMVNIPCECARPSYAYVFPSARRDIPLPFLQHRVIDITKIKTQLGYKDVVPVEEAIERTVKWLLENRPQPDGKVETSLGDSFDYAAEDHIIEQFKEFINKVERIPFGHMKLAHGYPKKPKE